ncbi:MAG: tyrosine-type recombinase/integrase [Actinomycetota bacterium]|nr:tyrosine-type recombinase/integrase [Actinomycetota bacterium]
MRQRPWRRRRKADRYNPAMTTFMNAALPVSTALVPTTADGMDLPVGLTEVDAARITAAISAARTESTRHVYALVWSQWERWCDARGIPALPGDPLALCAYLTERAEAGKATGTLDMACTAIRHVHRMSGAEDPVASEAVRQVRRGLMRTYGAAPRRLARPLTVDEIRQIVGAIDRTTPIGVRDTAIIFLGYASAMRRAELVALTLGDIEHKPAGLLLTIRRSKMDQEGHGQVVAVAHGQHAVTDPVPALSAWRAVRGEAPGALFTRIWASSVSLEPLSGHVVARMLRARAEAAGLDGSRITAHSLRAGHATAAALAGVPLNRIAAQTRHKDLSVLVNRYIRPLEALAHDLEQGPRPVIRSGFGAITGRRAPQ